VILVRDTVDRERAMLTFSAETWQEFLETVR
jgi:hypothetical protein